MDWDEIMNGFLVFVFFCIVLVIAFCLIMCMVDGEVLGYYIEVSSSDHITVYNIKQSIDWRPDKHIFATTNIQEAIKVMDQLKRP